MNGGADIAVNMPGGTRFGIVGVMMATSAGVSRVFGAIGVIIGACYAISSAVLFALSMEGSGEIIPLLARVPGP